MLKSGKLCTVTSRSGALTKFILWGHLLASDLDFYDDEPLNLGDDASWLMTGCFTIAIYRCYWLSFIECAGFRTLRMQRHRGNIPWTPDWVREWAIWVVSIYSDIVWFWWYDIDFMICFWHDLTWWLMMQADDSLPTRLPYGVKGPHMSSREIEREVWTIALPQPTSTPAVARTVG